jgi:hypothetical protein
LVSQKQILAQQEMLKNQQLLQAIDRNRVLTVVQVAGRVMGINWSHICDEEV